MFSARKSEPINFDKVDTVIGAETKLNGTISAKGTLRIDGEVEGKVVVQGDVVVGNTGVVAADIEAKSVAVSGTVRGNVKCSNSLELMPSAKLYGDISVKNLQIADGAVFEGRCEMMTQPDNKKENLKKAQG